MVGNTVLGVLFRSQACRGEKSALAFLTGPEQQQEPNPSPTPLRHLVRDDTLEGRRCGLGE